MKKILLMVLLCSISLGAKASFIDLMFATGNDYFNNCNNIDSRPKDDFVACMIASSNSFTAGQLMAAEMYHINILKYDALYQTDKIDGRTVHIQLLAYLKKHPDHRPAKLVLISEAAILENYPLSKTLIKELT